MSDRLVSLDLHSLTLHNQWGGLSFPLQVTPSGSYQVRVINRWLYARTLLWPYSSRVSWDLS